MKKIISSIITFAFVLAIFAPIANAQTATVPINITVAETFVVTDTSDNKNPTLTANISLTPDVPNTEQQQAADIDFRLRTNASAWKLTVQETGGGFMAGGTGIVASDVTIDLELSAPGASANMSGINVAGDFGASGLTGSTTLDTIDTAAAENAATGTSMTSSALNNDNSANFVLVQTDYKITPDFFYSAGTATSTLTYTLAAN